MKAPAGLSPEPFCRAVLNNVRSQYSIKITFSDHAMTLQQLRDFVAVVQQGSVRAAARSLQTSQSGLTKSLQNLESSLQVSLLHRTTRGITLTRYADALFVRAQAILRECDQAETAIQQLRGLGMGTVAFGVSTAPSLLLAPTVLADFRKRNPDVMVQLTSGLSHSLLPAVREGRLDFAIVPLPADIETEDLVVTKLFKSEPVVVARKDHPMARARSIRELAESEWLVLGSPESFGAPKGSVVDLFAACGLGSPRIAVTSNSMFDSLTILSETDLLAPLPRMILTAGIMDGKLVAIPLAEQLPRYEICLVHRHSVPLTPLASTLTSMFVSYARLVGPAG